MNISYVMSFLSSPRVGRWIAGLDRATAGATVRNPTIPIVEANATVGQLLEHALGHRGFSMRFANDADEARRIFERIKPSLRWNE